MTSIKTCAGLNYFEHFLVLIFAVSLCVSLSVFVLLVGAPAGITSSAAILKICTITAGTKSLSQLSRERGKTMIK